MTAPEAHVAGIGLIGPGIESWPTAVPVLAGSAPYSATHTVIPPLAVLPPAERRRIGQTVRLALAAGLQAVAHAQLDAATLPAVFASAGGDGANCHEICLTLASAERALSPTRFHNSVHNAPAGYWSIATGAREASQVLAALDGTFSAGLLEALTQVCLTARPVLLVAHDTPDVEPLAKVHPLPDAFAVALVLAPMAGPATLGHIRAHLQQNDLTPMHDPQLEALRAAVPAARSLPLLALLARLPTAGQSAGSVSLDYLSDLQLSLTVS
jgi:hypothetical protein